MGHTFWTFSPWLLILVTADQGIEPQSQGSAKAAPQSSSNRSAETESQSNEYHSNHHPNYDTDYLGNVYALSFLNGVLFEGIE